MKQQIFRQKLVRDSRFVANFQISSWFFYCLTGVMIFIIINKYTLSKNRCSHSDLSTDYSSGESITLFLSCHRRSHTLETLSFFSSVKKSMLH